ncbi:MAG: helix-turn-helix domain-containing protein [Haloarculaceae archaeon]
MAALEGVTASELREALETAEDPKAVKRLTIALAYLDGVPVGTLVDRYGVPQSTIYSWLDRFEERSLDDALHDDDRPGRPPKLDPERRETLADQLASPPDEFGYDATTWTPELLREHVEREFAVRYSVGHARRLLAELVSE